MTSASEIRPEERRHNPRKKLHELIYISLRQGNGGIVLDVSEGGLGFHTARPIELGEPIAFRFSVEALACVEVFGKLAWRDGSGKSGGLEFTNLPVALHDQILLWLDHPASSASRIPKMLSHTEVIEGFPSEKKPAIHQKPRVVAPVVIRRGLRLRGKMILCMALAAIGLNCLMAARIHQFGRNRANERLATGKSKSEFASRAVFEQLEADLGRKADLLSTLAAMTPDNDSTIQSSIENPLINDGSDLIAFADGTNQVAALYTSDRGMTPATVQEMLIDSLRQARSSDWWFADGKLYQVALASVHHEPLGHDRSGTVILGRRVDRKQVQDLADILGSQVAFTYAGKIVESTFNPYDEQELSQKLQIQSAPTEVQIGRNQFTLDSMKLTDGNRPVLGLMILQQHEETAGFENRGSRLLLRLVEGESIIVIALAGFALVTLRKRN